MAESENHQRSLSPSPSTDKEKKKKKLCVVFLSEGKGVRPRYYVEGSDEYQIYILDPDGYTLSEPTIQFEGCFPAMAWCGLDSTLYMFEGYEKTCFESDEKEASCFGGTYAGKLDLATSSSSSNQKLKKSDLVPIQPMRRTKISPIALATPHGKGILVFSSTFDSYSSLGPTFELYDVALDSWKCLPPLPLAPASYVMRHYGFETDSRFVVKVDPRFRSHGNGGTFVLDLEQPGQNWEPLLRRGSGHDMDCFIGVEGGYIFSACHYAGIRVAKDTGKALQTVPVSSSTFSLSSFPSTEFAPHLRHCLVDCFCPSIVLLAREDGGVYDICLVRAETSHSACHVIVDRCSVNIRKYETDVEKYDEQHHQHKGPRGPLLDITVTKTLKFKIHLHRETYVPLLMYSFSI